MRRAIKVVCLLCLLCGAWPARADDPGYFLSWQQKKDLLRIGRIQDLSGTWYDIWICPGYVPPARYAREHFKEAGSNFYEYFEANKYRSLKAGSKACFDWALDECGLGFTVKGIPRAWGTHFGVAHERAQRRVFGWWMAYPWAFLESTVETAFRGVLGSLGTVGGVLSGAAVVPAYHALDSAVAGVWNLGVNTIIVPVVGMGWNTVIGPPLALVGQKPAESRVDGFWVTVVGPDDPASERVLSPEETAQLGQWGLLLLKATEPVAGRQKELEKSAAQREGELRRAQQELRKDVDSQRAQLRNEEIALVHQAAATNALAVPAPTMAQAFGRLGEADVRRFLQAQGLAREDIERTVRLLRDFQRMQTVAPSPAREKTDPLRRSADVIKDSAVDSVKF